MQLQFLTWPDVEAYLKHSQGIILPIGSNEQHGPNGLIGTDSLCADAIARAAGENLEAVVAPPLAVGMAEHHMAFPGTITLRPSTLLSVIVDCVLSLSSHGFRRFLFINGHGGNTPTLKAAVSEIYGEVRRQKKDGDPDIRCEMINWYETEPVRKLREELFGDREGSHATPSEIAITHHLYPDHIRTAKVDTLLAPGGPFHSASDLRSRYPDGSIGSDSSLATIENGALLFNAAVDGISKAYAEFLKP